MVVQIIPVIRKIIIIALLNDDFQHIEKLNLSILYYFYIL